MEYDEINSPDGLIIRTAKDENYRTCSVCSQECEPDVGLGSDESGARIAFICAEHGIQSVVDPFEHLR